MALVAIPLSDLLFFCLQIYKNRSSSPVSFYNNTITISSNVKKKKKKSFLFCFLMKFYWNLLGMLMVYWNLLGMLMATAKGGMRSRSRSRSLVSEWDWDPLSVLLSDEEKDSLSERTSSQVSN